jgi:hypothetical protein
MYSGIGSGFTISRSSRGVLGRDLAAGGRLLVRPSRPDTARRTGSRLPDVRDRCDRALLRGVPRKGRNALVVVRTEAPPHASLGARPSRIPEVGTGGRPALVRARCRTTDLSRARARREAAVDQGGSRDAACTATGPGRPEGCVRGYRSLTRIAPHSFAPRLEHDRREHERRPEPCSAAAARDEAVDALVDEFGDVQSRQTIERVMEDSATQLAGAPRSPTSSRRWHLAVRVSDRRRSGVLTARSVHSETCSSSVSATPAAGRSPQRS